MTMTGWAYERKMIIRKMEARQQKAFRFIFWVGMAAVIIATSWGM